MDTNKIISWTGVAPSRLMSKTKKREVVFARWLVFDFLVLSGFNLARAGAELDKDHSTVSNALKTLPEKLLQMHPEERIVFDSFRAGFNRWLDGECEQDMFFSDEMLGMLTDY